jgi:hypothetical protein
MANFRSALDQLQQERNRLASQLDQVARALAALKGGRAIGRRKLSAAGISRIRAAQKTRWAKWRQAHKKN